MISKPQLCRLLACSGSRPVARTIENAGEIFRGWMDSAIHRISHYPVNNSNTYSLNSLYLLDSVTRPVEPNLGLPDIFIDSAENP